ncbi:toll/interleukin-1 receptor domain-containing adapter protein isoform X2 [Rhinatrema bivittatum]|uniref:toll/interleukin-1 receptor domain-containing adapter protein isoform X2 n=1 Tax=Rhinatrema bivittatum TaxID=194408 RepID=UPI00112A5AEF|nr:toll/interleukin-1 receptor domain-containing adapter protein isoform X2 [Rhinatrema bivittatum]
MSGWFRQLKETLKKKPTPMASHPVQSRSVCSASATSKDSMPHSLATQPAMMKRNGCSGHARWTKQYDVCICHSQQDTEYVMHLVSYLEQQPEKFRCFLQLRDAALGGAISTELCYAVRNSHCWVMLITQNFLQDPWCKYQMHQALAEAPLTNGRTIPVVKDLDRACYPDELRFMYYIRVTLEKESDFQQIKRAVLLYLQDLCSSEIYITSSALSSKESDNYPSTKRPCNSDSRPSTESTHSSDMLTHQ